MGRSLFIAAHKVVDPDLFTIYKRLMKDQRMTYEEIRLEQEKHLRKIVNFAYESVPYYHRLFKKIGLKPEDILKIEDLKKLPILTKDMIKQNWEEFKPTSLKGMKYKELATGGSTGTPFKYRVSKLDFSLSDALRYRGWSYGGYQFGDRIAILGGASLRIDSRENIKRKIREFVLNAKMFSSFDMTEKEMAKFVKIFNSKQPKFLNGYASSLFFLANWIERNNVEIWSPSAAFSTAERLFPYMREKISSVFSCEVFDGYGLNDSGASAVECDAHEGLHIDEERSILEIIDTDGGQLDDGRGSIVATSLRNFALPFIRYNTGDIGYISSVPCSCGRKQRLLKEIIGREQEMLETPEGKFIHGEFFTHIFWEIKGVKEFQVVQRKLEEITIKIVADEKFDKEERKKIEGYIKSRSSAWVINFQLVDNIEKTESGKYRFVRNELKK